MSYTTEPSVVYVLLCIENSVLLAICVYKLLYCIMPRGYSIIVVIRILLEDLYQLFATA